MMTHEAAANTTGTPTNQAASPICQVGRSVANLWSSVPLTPPNEYAGSDPHSNGTRCGLPLGAERPGWGGESGGQRRPNHFSKKARGSRLYSRVDASPR